MDGRRRRTWINVPAMSAARRRWGRRRKAEPNAPARAAAAGAISHPRARAVETDATTSRVPRLALLAKRVRTPASNAVYRGSMKAFPVGWLPEKPEAIAEASAMISTWSVDRGELRRRLRVVPPCRRARLVGSSSHDRLTSSVPPGSWCSVNAEQSNERRIIVADSADDRCRLYDALLPCENRQSNVPGWVKQLRVERGQICACVATK